MWAASDSTPFSGSMGLGFAAGLGLLFVIGSPCLEFIRTSRTRPRRRTRSPPSPIAQPRHLGVSGVSPLSSARMRRLRRARASSSSRAAAARVSWSLTWTPPAACGADSDACRLPSGPERTAAPALVMDVPTARPVRDFLRQVLGRLHRQVLLVDLLLPALLCDAVEVHPSPRRRGSQRASSRRSSGSVMATDDTPWLPGSPTLR